MKKQHRMILTALLSGSLLIAACSPSSKTATPDANLVITQAAMTVAAQLTQSAALTPKPTNPPLPTDTSAAPAATPTTPPIPQATAAPAATNTTAPDAPSAANDAASFVTDVSIPDGTVIAPGGSFVKTWRIKNNGVTTWNTSYSILFIDGEKMGSPDSVAMPKEVKPGETVDISVKLTAPAKTGSYQAFYRLRNAGGQFFHLDQSGDLWLKITVGTPSDAATATPSSTETAGPESATATAAPTSAD